MTSLVPVAIDRGIFCRSTDFRTSIDGRLVRAIGNQPPTMMSFKVNASNHDPKKFGEPFGYWYLHDDIGEWLMNHGIISIHCSLCFDVHSEVWSLCVPERVALLFKLTWGGR